VDAGEYGRPRFLSRATFARHFARAYHLTPQAWLSQLRMAMAARLLRVERQTNLDVIAGRCGFQSQASFSKAFKKLYGVTRRVAASVSESLPRAAGAAEA
jgi:AraC-like DNA-binding protein